MSKLRKLSEIRVARRIFEEECNLRDFARDADLDRIAARALSDLVVEIFEAVESAPHLMREEAFRRIHDELVKTFVEEELFDVEG